MNRIWYRTCVFALALSAALLLSYQSKTLGRSSPKTLAKPMPARTAAPLARSASPSTPFSIPLTFEPNQAQAPAAQFVGRGQGLAVALTRDGIDLAAASAPRALEGSRESAVASLRFAQGRLVWRGVAKVRAESNYFVGNDPRKWRTHVPHFARAEATANGIGIVVYGNEEGLEYDLKLRPGADVSKLGLSLAGATRVRVDANGDAVMLVGTSEFRMKKPAIFEERDAENETQRSERTAREDTEHKAQRRRIDGEYVIEADGTIGFRVLGRDPNAALVIDPSISVAYASFLGGAGSDTASSVAVDSTGKIYIGGTTTSPTTFLETTTAQLGPGIGSGSAGAAEFFIAKIDPTQTGANSLVYLTFLGGSANQAGGLIAVDSKGDVAITGTTTSSDFPVFPAADTSARTSGSNDTTVTEIDPTGAKLLYSTIFGGNGAESSQGAGGIALDAAGNIFVASDTNSTNLPVTTGSYGQTYVSPTTDGFLAVFEPSTTLQVTYCTYLGLDGQIGIGGVAVDAAGNAYIAGFTSDPNADFPVTNSLQTTYGGGAFDAFLMKISPSGGGASDLIYATLLGGNGSDQAFAVAVDSVTPPNAYVTGTTASTNFPTNGTVAAYQTSLPASATSLTSNAFLSVVAQTALGVPSLAYSTYLGGSQVDAGQSISVAAPYAVYLTGTATSWNFPWRDNFQPFNGYGDAFVAELDTTSAGAASLLYATPLGGTSPPGANASAQGSAIALDAAGNVWAVGQTTSADFPSAGSPANGFQPICASCQQSPPFTDAFVVEIQENAAQQLPSVYFSAPGVPLNFGQQPLGSINIPPQFAAVKNGGEAPLQISSVGITGPNSGDFALVQPATCAGTTISPGDICSFEVSFTPSVVGNEVAFAQFQDNAPGNPQTLELIGAGVGLAALPASLNFVDQTANTTSKPESATLTNTASDSIFIDTVLETGANVPMFPPHHNAADCKQEVLVSESSCQLSYQFAPTSAGAFQAEVEIQYHVQGLSEQEQVIPLSGVGTPAAPIASVTPTTLNFGTVSVGATGQTQVVTLSNTGSAALNVTTIGITGTNAAEFSLVASGNTPCPTSSGSVSIGGSCTIGVGFAPKTPGTKSATLTFADNAAGTPQTVALSGTAQTTAIQISPTSLAFNGQSVGTKSAPQPITITNAGTSALAINGVTISGSNLGDFAQSNNCPPSLGANATCTVNVAFQPAATGPRSASISVSDDAPNSPQTVALTGTGTQAAVTLSPAGPINFGNQAVGAGTPGASSTVTVTNSGTGALAVSKISFSGANAGDFTETDTCNVSVAAGGTCTIKITFDPQCGNSQAARAASLNIADNVPGSPQSIALSGTATGSICFAVPVNGTTTTTVVAGSNANYSLEVGAANGYTGSVTLAYAGCPPSATCTVTPTSASVGGSTLVPFTATVGTSAGPYVAILHAPPDKPRSNPPGKIGPWPSLRDARFVLGALAWLASLFAVVATRRRCGLVLRLVAIAAFICAIGFGIAACGGGTYTAGGGGDPGTPAGTYTITVTGTANGTAQPFPLTLTVD
jgi:hypothetical protein